MAVGLTEREREIRDAMARKEGYRDYQHMQELVNRAPVEPQPQPTKRGATKKGAITQPQSTQTQPEPSIGVMWLTPSRVAQQAPHAAQQTTQRNEPDDAEAKRIREKFLRESATDTNRRIRDRDYACTPSPPSGSGPSGALRCSG